jgi:hypothetical protein
MKSKLVLATTLLSLLPASTNARSVSSPDGKFVVEVGSNRSVLKDRAGNVLVELEPDIGAPHLKVQVMWAPDSKAVALAIDDKRATMISLGWQTADEKWLSKSDSDDMVLRAEKEAGGRTVYEQRKLLDWKGPALEVEGELATTAKQGYHYTYLDRVIDKQVVSTGFEPIE